MPKIAEIRQEGSGEVWVLVGKIGEFPSGIHLWTPEEASKKYRDGYIDGYDDAVAGKPKQP